MIIDAHQHFWLFNETDYIWMDDTMAILKKDHDPSHLRPLMSDVGVDGTVAVQARQMAVETDYLLSLSADVSWILGVVGWLDVESETLEANLERYADNPKLKGFRELIHDMPDESYAVSAPHVNAVSLLRRHGFTYDLLVRPPHIDAAIQLVDIFPDQPFVVDHIAKPDIAQQAFEPWRTSMTKLAGRENVYCKLSGMVTEANHDTWKVSDLDPYIDIILSAFGPQRLMIGSDWPVCTLAGTYDAVMSVTIDYVSRLSPSEQRAILAENATRFYGLYTT